MFNNPYTTANPEELAKKTLLWIVGINVGVFLLQLILGASGGRGLMEDAFGLSLSQIGRGFVWTPITYAFLHDTRDLMHIAINMILIFLIGRQIFLILGLKRFLQLYFACAFTGGLIFLAAKLVSVVSVSSVVGASGVWYGLLAFYVLLAPEEEILFMFVLRMKRKVVGYIMLGIGLVGLIFHEILGSGFNIAHSAHLGGMLGGFLFHRYVFSPNPYASGGGINLSIPKFFKKSEKKKPTEKYRYQVNVGRSRDLKREVDGILDKINSKGFGSLTPEEKKTLDEAKDLLRKR